MFIIRDEEMKIFRQFMEAIDFAFICTSYQLLKITFQDKQNMVVPKNNFFQTWQDVCIFLVLVSPRLDFSFFNFFRR